MIVYIYIHEEAFNEWNVISMGLTRFEETPFYGNLSQTLSEFRVGDFEFEFNLD